MNMLTHLCLKMKAMVLDDLGSAGGVDMDIYFKPEWGIVNQFIEPGTAKVFECRNEYGSIRNQFILRRIPHLLDGKQFYDITSPYGYGGPYIADCKEGRKDELIKAYEEQFASFCNENDIISEFVRFHPIIRNDRDFKDIYNAQYDRHTVGTNLEDCADPVQEEFSKSARKCIRRAMRAGITWDVIQNPDDVNEFVEIYYSTMNRDNANDFYYFSKEYFDNCVRLFGEHIILVRALYEGRVVAEGFYITSGSTIHAHLSGTLKEYIHMSPAYVIKYATAVWGKEHGYKLIHYGGGTSNAPEDSLFQFKCKFTKETIFDFYLGKKIWNSNIYEKLVALTGKNDTEFFPAYRG